MILKRKESLVVETPRGEYGESKSSFKKGRFVVQPKSIVPLMFPDRPSQS